MAKLPARKGLLRDLSRDYQIYLLMLPTLIYFAVFCYYPMLGVQIAFKEFKAIDGIWGSPWVGLAQFERFFKSYQAKTIISNTLEISLYQLAAGFPMPILLALLINQLSSQRFKRTLQTITYAPHFVSVPAVAGLILIILSPSSGGVFYSIIQALTGSKVAVPMGKPSWFSSIFVVSHIWQHCGWDAIIYIAALTAISPDLYEAAEIDGAGKLQKIWYIDIPSILPTAIIILILNSGRIMSVGFEKVLLLQNASNLPRSEIISTYVYKSGLISSEYSYSTAINLFNSVINLFLITTVNFIAGRVSDISIW